MRKSYAKIRTVADCYFYPGRDWMAEYRPVVGVTPDLYQSYMETGYFRQGPSFYQPVCLTCRECIAMRVVVDKYRASKSQNRLWRLNGDLRVQVGKPTYSDDKFALYQRYHAQRWGWTTDEPEGFIHHMLIDWGGAWEFSYWEGEKLLALGIVDEMPRSANSRYFIYETEGTRSRGLGIYSLLHELEWCTRRGKAHLYLGMYVANAPCMDYKVSMRPFELRLPGSPGAETAAQWVEFADKNDALAHPTVRILGGLEPPAF